MSGDTVDSAAAIFGLPAMPLATLVLVATYAVLIADRFNRAVVALSGAAATLVLGLLAPSEAVHGVDWNTIALLLGMMLLVGVSRRSGMFEYVAVWAAQRVRAHPAGLLAALQVVTAVLSAFLDNVTTVLLVVPVTLIIVERLKLDPYPYLFSEILASNIGGTATLIGDPPNILIGNAVPFTFNQFLIHLSPVVAIVMVVQAALLHLMWGRRLEAHHDDRAHVMRLEPHASIVDGRLLVQSLAVLALVIAGFVLAHTIGVLPGITALAGAGLLMLLDAWGAASQERRRRVVAALEAVDWVTILFFVGLFVVVAAVERSGLLQLLADRVVQATCGSLPATTMVVLWSSAILSAIVDNIPFVATMLPLIRAMAPHLGGVAGLDPVWWSLALGACFGGNGTLIGASANLTVAGLGERAGYPIGFTRFTLHAFPLMLVSVAIAAVYVWLRYLT